MKQEKWMSLLGLANRARKIISGEELVIKEIQKRQSQAGFNFQRCLSKHVQENTGQMQFLPSVLFAMSNQGNNWVTRLEKMQE